MTGQCAYLSHIFLLWRQPHFVFCWYLCVLYVPAVQPTLCLFREVTPAVCLRMRWVDRQRHCSQS
jgi:hypothetical protein